MSKRFIDYYLDAVTKKSGGGGGSATIYPYKPASGYTGMPLADGRSMNLSQIKNRGTNTFWYGALPEIAPVVGDKMCFYGVADDDGTDAPFAVWGTISQYYAYTTYCYIKFSAYDGASYVEDGVQTVVGGGSFVSDGNDNLTVDAVATLYPIKPPASLGYKEMAVTQNLTLTNLKNYWNNKNTNAQYRTALDDTLASGDKVLLVGYATDSGKTWPFALWGTVNTTVKYTSYMYVKLATYDGLSIMKLDSTYDSMVGEAHIYENGTYTADSGNSIEVNVGTTGTDHLAERLNQSASYAYESDAVTQVPASAFFYDHRITSIKLKNCKKISSQAFQNAFNMETAYFGAVTSIATKAFKDCWVLKSLVISGGTSVATLDNTDALDFQGTTTHKIYVPDALVSSYKTATNWSTYASMIYPLSQYEG